MHNIFRHFRERQSCPVFDVTYRYRRVCRRGFPEERESASSQDEKMRTVQRGFFVVVFGANSSSLHAETYRGLCSIAMFKNACTYISPRIHIFPKMFLISLLFAVYFDEYIS